ncbi:hypothetical protein K435DRAFT_714730 [Dendrothele bispora CBS 962.96]|uniref:BTB domain-containing protein n=1 Tax=Dendrothele bispora (strain CBS 962.96) TaxID=1314807 RepID=A0A4S8MMV9_DENBC|nr:hypothetical protein K435DRAFT_714730 [Dendrothele bispora CBS 962.96]
MSTESDSSQVCTRVSKSFNHPTSDITLQSSDRVLFKVHRRNLEMYSQVFADAAGATVTVPPSTPTRAPASLNGTIEQPLSSSSSSSQLHDNTSSPTPQPGEIVHLSESSAVLDLMFQYMYLQPQPDLRKVDFDVIKDLAEAVEKYCVYSAMGALNVRMREHIPSQPVEVLLYAIRHNYPELINESAEATLEFPPYPMLQRVPPDVFSAWISYQQAYHVLLSKEFTRFGPKRNHASSFIHSQHNAHSSNNNSSNELSQQGCKSWYEHYSMITSVIGPRFGYSPSLNSGPSPTTTTSPAGRMGLASTSFHVGGASGTLAGLGGPSSRWASFSLSSTSSPYHPTPPTSASSPSTLNLFFSTLQQRHLLASSVINFESASGCSGCKRELGYWIQQAERDWRYWKEGNGDGRFEEYL